MLGTYRRVFRVRGITIPFLASFLGSLPIGILTLAILLLVQSRTGSFAEGAIVSGCYGAGNAIGVVIQGRLIDRRGQTVVLVPASLLCGIALLVLVCLARQGVPAALCAVVGGLGFPATITSMRALIPHSLPDEQLRATGYAMLAGLFSIAALLGTLVVAGLLPLVGPAGATIAGAAVATGAGLVFAATPASRAWHPARHDTISGRLLSPGLRTLLAGAAVMGFTGGMGGVGIPALAVQHGVPSLAALLSAAFSIGDLLGGVGYGARSWSMRPSRQLVWGRLVSAAIAFSIAAALGVIPLLFVLEFMSGLVAAPPAICTSALLDNVARRDALAQSYATLVCIGLLSASAGNAVGGLLVGTIGIRALFVITGCGLAVIAVWTQQRRTTLEHRQMLTFR